MNTHIAKVLGAAGSAGALALLCLIGAGGAASASPSSVQRGPVGVVALKMPGSFQPAAASFVSPTWGVVLGTTGCTTSRACRAQLAVTGDGGAHWSPMRTPAVWLANDGSSRPQVSQVVFAGRSDGWLYNQYNGGQIWVTHNGGTSWREITLSGNIQMMAASADAVYAVAGNQLYRSPLGWNAWTRVTAPPRSGPMTGSALAASGASVWFGSSTYLWATTDGVHWARYPLRSPGTYYGTPYALAGIASASRSDVALLYAAATGMFHSGMKVLVSFNGGRSERQTLKAPPPEGDVAAFAAAPGPFGVITIAVVTPGLDNIYRSANLGQTWTTFGIPGTSGGAMLDSLQFMNPTVGSFVIGDPAFGIPGKLLRTADAGRTWHPATF
jgi:hypothetical protein